jgi:predicted nucleic acid-binding protein
MTMKQYVLGTDAVCAFLENKPGATTVEELLWKAAQSQQRLHMSVISWGALLCAMRQSRGAKATQEKVKQLELLPIDLIEVDAAAADNAATICANHDVPFPESFALALAQQRRATLVTTNKGLLKLGDEVKVLVAT